MNQNSSKTNGNGGWICLHRKMLEASWYGKKPNATCLAIHLLLSATHQDMPVTFCTRKGWLLRGQYITGRKALAEETGLTEWQAYRALKVLEKAGFLHIKSNMQYSIVTICNYNAYQDKEPNAAQQFAQREPSDAQRPPSKCTTGGSNLHTKQQRTKNKEQSITQKDQKKVFNDLVLRTFNKLWDMYPRKVGRKKAFLHYKASVKDSDDMRDCHSALLNYKNSKRVRDNFVWDGSRFFNNWEDWIVNPEEDKAMNEMEYLLQQAKKGTS